MNAKQILTGIFILWISTLLGNPGKQDQTQPGPWDNDVYICAIDAQGHSEKLATFERAGVPTIARLNDGRLIAAFQNFPQDDDRNFDRVAVRFSSDEGLTWSRAEAIVVSGMEEGYSRPFDPTLVPLPDGRVRIYFTSNQSPDFRKSIPAIFSGISTDGIHYTFEKGMRFGIEGRIVIDCAVALHEGVFHLIAPDNGTAEGFGQNQQNHRPPPAGKGYHATSKDGLNFERVADVTLSSEDRWLGNMQSDKGRLVFFGTGRGPWPVVSTDGISWTLDSNAFRLQGADPGGVRLKNGNWLTIVTSGPRPGTPSALKMPRKGPPNVSPERGR